MFGKEDGQHTTEQVIRAYSDKGLHCQNLQVLSTQVNYDQTKAVKTKQVLKDIITVASYVI